MAERKLISGRERAFVELDGKLMGRTFYAIKEKIAQVEGFQQAVLYISRREGQQGGGFSPRMADLFISDVRQKLREGWRPPGADWDDLDEKYARWKRSEYPGRPIWARSGRLLGGLTKFKRPGLGTVVGFSKKTRASRHGFKGGYQNSSAISLDKLAAQMEYGYVTDKSSMPGRPLIMPTLKWWLRERAPKAAVAIGESLSGSFNKHLRAGATQADVDWTSVISEDSRKAGHQRKTETWLDVLKEAEDQTDVEFVSFNDEYATVRRTGDGYTVEYDI